MEEIEKIKIGRDEMHGLGNYIRHGIFTTLYAFFKNASFPFFNYFRFAIVKLFAKKIQSTYIADGVTFWFPWNISIGRRSSLNQGVIIDGTGGVEIGDGVRIAAYTMINTADHEMGAGDMIVEQGFVVGKVIIEDDVWIGANVMINKAVRIGKGSVIGAGSVITKSIPPYSIAAGVPCKVISSRK
jgi:acetyltransferase-like isoleucine patch superfamily enzyme